MKHSAKIASVANNPALATFRFNTIRKCPVSSISRRCCDPALPGFGPSAKPKFLRQRKRPRFPRDCGPYCHTMCPRHVGLCSSQIRPLCVNVSSRGLRGTQSSDKQKKRTFVIRFLPLEWGMESSHLSSITECSSNRSCEDVLGHELQFP